MESLTFDWLELLTIIIGPVVFALIGARAWRRRRSSDADPHPSTPAKESLREAPRESGRNRETLDAKLEEVEAAVPPADLSGTGSERAARLSSAAARRRRERSGEE